MFSSKLSDEFQTDYLALEMERLKQSIKEALYVFDIAKSSLSAEELTSLDKHGQVLGYCRSVTDYAKHYYTSSRPLDVYDYISREKYSRIKTLRNQTLIIVRGQSIDKAKAELGRAAAYLTSFDMTQLKTQYLIDDLKKAREGLAPFGDKSSLVASLRQNLSNIEKELDEETVSKIRKLAAFMEAGKKSHLTQK
ncbi:MAG TPA: hypothetical protein DCL21_01810 [Alphaproteobacteria bacterium]|nr:hypothetical protein [Alphaproteobacteria bacterium]